MMEGEEPLGSCPIHVCSPALRWWEGGGLQEAQPYPHQGLIAALGHWLSWLPHTRLGHVCMFPGIPPASSAAPLARAPETVASAPQTGDGLEQPLVLCPGPASGGGPGAPQRVCLLGAISCCGNALSVENGSFQERPPLEGSAHASGSS